jgi:hypothetical protein
MIREEYIEEIKKHILSARIEKVYNADLVVKNNGENSLIFPSFNQIIEYVNKASNVDKFFERINTTLDNYDKYVKGNNVSKIKVTLEPLEKRIKVSEETINTLTALPGTQKELLCKMIETKDFVSVMSDISKLSDKDSINNSVSDMIISHIGRGLKNQKSLSPNIDLIEKSMLYSLSTKLTSIICKVTNTDL